MFKISFSSTLDIVVSKEMGWQDAGFFGDFWGFRIGVMVKQSQRCVIQKVRERGAALVSREMEYPCKLKQLFADEWSGNVDLVVK